MKFLVWIGAILTVLVATLYIVAFTPAGNALVKPIVEAKIQEGTKTQSTLETFLLGMSDFEIVLELNQGNRIKAKGEYSLFEKSFVVHYEADLKNLQALESYVQKPLRGAFYTEGTAKGDMRFIEIDGKSDVGASDTSYHVALSDLNPTSIIAKVKGAKLSSLLYLGAQNPYATADIDMDINFRNIKEHALDGEIVLKTKEGKIDPKYMLSDFNVTIPEASFAMNLDAKLKGDDVEYRYELLSNLFKIGSSGVVVPQPLKADLKYSLNVQDLEVLKPLTKAEVRGAFKLSGSVKGTKERLVVQGVSDLAASDTVFEAVLKEFSPASLKAKIANLDIAKLLYMLKQPHYTDGLFSMQADISDMKPESLSGTVATTLTKGVLDSAYLSKAYKFATPMPKTTFNAATTTLLKGTIVDTKIDFNSNIADLDVKNARFDVKEGSLKSDYKLFVADLNALFFITKQRMRGDFTAEGEMAKGKDIDFSMHANIADGKMEAKMHNDDFHADLSSLKTTKLLYMLYYPELFDAALSAKLDYNAAQSKGKLDGQVTNGVFAKNQTFDLIKQFTKFDMYRENFNGDVGAKIEKERMLVSADLRSKEAALKTTDTKLNTKTNQIDSEIVIVAKSDSINANLKGDINSPKVSVDLEKFLQSETGKKVIKKVDKLLEKFLK